MKSETESIERNLYLLRFLIAAAVGFSNHSV